jgi:hypothetical protein
MDGIGLDCGEGTEAGMFLFAGGFIGYGCFRKETVIQTGGIKGVYFLLSSDWGLCPGRWKCSWRARVRCFRVFLSFFG